MVNLLPEEFRREEEREHNATLAEQQQEDVVMYTQSKVMNKAQGRDSVETSRGDISSNRGVSNKTPQGGVSPTVSLPAFVQHGAIKKESLFHALKKKIRALFKKSSDITPTVHAQLKPQQHVLKTIDLGKKAKKEDSKNQSATWRTKKKKPLFPRMQVNLISEDVLMERSEHIAFVRIGMVALASVCIVGVVWFLLQFAVTQKQVRIDQLISTKDIVEKEVNRITTQTTAARKIQTRITAAQALASEHISWLKLLSFFEENTLSAVSFDGITLDKNDPYTYSLQATAPQVEDMLAQWRVFEDSEQVESAIISGYSRQDDTVIASTPETGHNEEGQPKESPPQLSQQAGISFTIEIVLKSSLFE